MHVQRNGLWRYCLASREGMDGETPRWTPKDGAFLSICHSGRENLLFRAARLPLLFVSVYRHRRSFGSVIQTEGAIFTHRNHAPCVHPPIDNYCCPDTNIRGSEAPILSTRQTRNTKRVYFAGASDIIFALENIRFFGFFVVRSRSLCLLRIYGIRQLNIKQ